MKTIVNEAAVTFTVALGQDATYPMASADGFEAASPSCFVKRVR